MLSVNVPIAIQDSFASNSVEQPLADVLDDWRSIFHAEAAVLAQQRIGTLETEVLACSGIDQRYVALYVERWCHEDPWGLKAGRGEGAWLTDDLCPRDRLICTEFFKRWLQPQQLEQGVRAVINLPDDRIWIITILFHAQVPPPKRFLLGALGVAFPLLKTAARMLNSVEDSTHQRDAMIGVLDHLTVGVVLIDGRGRPIAMNRSAGELIAKSGALVVGRHGVYASKPLDSQRLQQMIERQVAQAPSNEPVPEAVPIRRSGTAVPMSVIGTSLRRPLGTGRPEDPAVALFISDPDEAPADAAEERLMALYALTRLEARLATRLVSGRSLDEIASDLRVSIHTVRAYLKQIFAKTNVHRQSDLVRILMNGMAHVRTSGRALAVVSALALNKIAGTDLLSLLSGIA